MIRQFEGGYSDYLIRKELESPESGNVSASLKAQNASSGKDNSESDENDNNSANSQDAWKRREKKLKFSFKEQREFDTIDEEIEDIKTLWMLRKEAFLLHIDFLADGSSQT